MKLIAFMFGGTKVRDMIIKPTSLAGSARVIWQVDLSIQRGDVRQF